MRFLVPVVLFVLLGLVVSPASAEPIVGGNCEGEELGTIKFDGCMGHFCQGEHIQGKYREVVRNSLGDSVTELRVLSAALRLESLRRFYQVNASCSFSDDGKVDVLFEVFTRSVIRELQIEGNVQFYMEELKKRIFLRPGVLIALGQADGEAEIRRQEETLVNFYERGGFVEPSIEVSFTSLSADDVKCTVRINEGKRRRIEWLSFRYMRELQSDTVPDDELAPEWRCPIFRKRELEEESGLRDMEVFTERAAREVRTRLTEYLQRYGVIDPRVAMKYSEDTGALSVDIRYENCHRIQFLVRSDVSVKEDSYRNREMDSWRSVLSFGSSGTFDFGESEYSRRLLESHLENEGFLFSDVRLDYREVFNGPESEADKGTPVSGISTYLVTEGYITEIRKVAFPGMNFMDSDKIRAQFETQKYDFFGDGGYLQVQKFFSELKDLQMRYREEGFHRHKFVGFTPTEGEYIRSRERRGQVEVYSFVSGDIGFLARKPEGENVVYLEAKMEEGSRSRLESLTLEGCGDQCKSLRNAMGWEDGQPYSRNFLKNSLRKAQRFFDGSGQPKVTFSLRCRGEAPLVSEEDCNPEVIQSERVRLFLSMVPGPYVRVGEVFTTGNFLTLNPVITRDLPNKGDLLRLDNLRESERKLRNLGVFNTVRVLPQGLEDGGSLQEVPLLIEMEESSSQFIDFALGFESLNRVDLSSAELGKMPPPVSSLVSNGVELEDRMKGNVGSPVPFEVPDLLLVFQTEYLNTNFFGNAQEFRFPIKYGLSTTDPWRVLAGAPTWIERRFLGTDLVFRQTLYGLFDKARNPFDLVETGSQSEISTALTDSLFLSAKYNVSGSSVRELDVENATFETPRLLNKLSPTLSWQKLDALTHPTEGFGASLTTSLINSVILEDSDVSNYFKFLTSLKGFLNARGKIVFANFLRFGGAFSLEGDLLPEVERFRLGGGKGVRGFEDGEISQYNRNGTLRDGDPDTLVFDRVDGGDYTLSGTTELRFPLMVEVGPLELWGAAFFDWGGLADQLTDFHSRSFRSSVGLGMRMLLYGRVPIRLDYGIKLDPRCKIPSEEDLECVERESSGELDFNLLYTF